jgi:hypothetical protein
MDAPTPMLLRTPVTVMNGLTEAEEIVSGFSGLTLDAATLYSGPVTTTIAAPQLVGHTVYSVADGAVLPAQVVPAGGVVTLPVPASTIWVGLPFASVGRTDFPDVAVRGTNGQRIKKRYVRLLARLEQSACLVLHGERIPFRSASMPQDQGVVPFSGDKEVTPLGFSQRAVVEFIVDQPLPCTLISLFGTLDIEADR